MAISLDDGLKRAEALTQRGQTGEARQIYQAVLQHDPGNRTALEALAALDRRAAEFQALTELYQKGACDEVLERGAELLRQYPDTAFLHGLMGNANAAMGKGNEAIACYGKSLQLRPDIAETHVNLGKTLGQLQRGEEAVTCFRNALRLRPRYADAYYSLGVVLQALNRNEEAVAGYQATIELRPDFAEAHENMGIVLRKLGDNESALASFRRALALRPGNAATHVQAAITLGKLKRYPESNAAFATALKLDPTLADAHGQKLFQAAVMCDWGALAAERDAIATLGTKGQAVRPFVMLPLEDRPDRHRIRAERFAAGFEASGTVIAPPLRQPGRIRIGYFSAVFHNHPVMHLLGKLLEAHDRSRFELHAYSYGAPANDAERKRAQAAMEIFHDVHGLEGTEIAERARKDGIDIAIDLMGYTENALTEIFANRAAPIQINYLGYPGTMGGPFMDYLIADRVLVPEGHEGFYSEKIIHLPASFMPSDDGREISDRAIARTEMGLPEQGLVFCCFNNSYKIGPEEFAIWMRLMRQVEGSVLWLSGTNSFAMGNLRNAAKAAGIDPARVIFSERLPMGEHLARHRLADLFLDTFHYNAHSTASDALWTGLPVITKAGRGFPARVGASLLHAAGLSELVTDSTEAYEKLALDLAIDSARLRSLKTKLAGLRSTAPLFDTKRYARHLEDGFAQAYRRYFDGEAPAHIRVPD